MVERVKSVVLTVLILNSLLLSGLLWYKSPNVEEINHTDYIPQQLIGESRQPEELVLPRSVVYHNGNGQHFMSFPGDQLFDRVTEGLAEGQFRQMDARILSSEEWDDLLQQTPGWELRFPTRLPVDILTERLYPGMEQMEKLTSIDRIWIYRQENELKALLISDFDNRIYDSHLIVNNEADVFKETLESGLLSVTPVTEEEISVHPYEPNRMRMSYFPDQKISLAEWMAPLQEIDLEQMKNLLFLDPSLVRIMTDADEGAIIMQDGSRSVRFVEKSRMLHYQNYKLKLETKPVHADLNEAIQYVNQHGGWMADYQLTGMDSNVDRDNANRYEFHLMHNGWPVYDKGNQSRYGTRMTVESKGGHVLRYDRSLHFTSEDEYVKQNSVPGGNEALDDLLSHVDMARVRDMFPAYRVARQKKEDVLRYIPGWRIQLTNGDEGWFQEFIADGGKANGLE